MRVVVRALWIVTFAAAAGVVTHRSSGRVLSGHEPAAWFPEPPFGGIARQAPLPGRSWTTPSPNCYATLVGATSLRDRGAYVGYVINALVSARALRRLGSVADFVVMVEYDRDAHDEASPPPLPEEALLASHGVRVAYLASAASPPWYRFAATTARKFDAYLLDGCARVQFLDSDVLPLKNMDYAFDAVDASAPDAFGAGASEPAQAGWFLATPSAATRDALLAPAYRLGFRDKRFNHGHGGPGSSGSGWSGAPLGAWRTQRGEGRGWHFNGARGDQGLMYQYARFASRGALRVFFPDRVETWPNATTPSVGPLPFRPGFLLRYGDYDHYTGQAKPWLGREAEMPDAWRDGFRDLRAATAPEFAGLLNLTFPLARPRAGFSSAGAGRNAGRRAP